MAAHKWTVAQRKAASIRTKNRIRLKKSLGVPQDKYPDVAMRAETPQEAAVDLNRLRERSFHNGLVTAIECILRELR